MFSAADAGTGSGQFLKMEPGARAGAMGSAYSAISDDSTAIYWNPAGLAQMKSGSICFMHALWFEEIAYDWFSVAQPVGKFGAIGLGFQYLNYASIPCFDISGNDCGSLTSYDMAASLSYAKRLGALSLGATAKYISSKLDNTATTMAYDGGLMYRFKNKRLSLGCAVQNIGGSLKYYEESIDIPMNLRFGAGYRFSKKFLVTCDVSAADGAPKYGAGAEYKHKAGEETSILIRGGYNTKGSDAGGLGGISAGLGISYKSFALDYAFVPYGKIGDTNRISLGIKY